MTHRTLATILCGVSLALTAVAADPPRQENLGDILVPPEMVMRFATEVGIDDAQKQAIRAEMQKVQERFPDLQQNLQKEVAALAEIARQDATLPDKALAQLDKVLDAEREIKRAQLSMVLAIRGKLKPEQWTKLRELREKMIAEARAKDPNQPPEALREKMQRLQERAKAAQQNGTDLSGVQEIMKEFQSLAQTHNWKEAESALDRALAAVDNAPKK